MELDETILELKQDIKKVQQGKKQKAVRNSLSEKYRNPFMMGGLKLKACPEFSPSGSF